MIRILAITNNLKPIYNLTIEEIDSKDIKWYWIDFNNPTNNETNLLSNYFHFHSLAIEDCISVLNSPKLDYYDDYDFFVFNALDKNTLKPLEVDIFVNEKYVVSYHKQVLNELDEAWKKANMKEGDWGNGTTYIVHQILDKIVDNFFPAVYKIEDILDDIENKEEDKSIYDLIGSIFQIRKELLVLRKTINSMRDLLYRMLNSERLRNFHKDKIYFSDIYDHLLKLSSMIESSREMTADIRDNYLSVNSAKMNRNMMVLTVITTIFIPLTFIAGVYGMNFRYMPELNWRYGYFAVWIVMLIIAITMYLWFKNKGWMDK
ncbi:magnesium and cobalt transport protein CorA [Clostridium pasteurianum DSM 525 = ATCC 6013]|uniref:Magnesium transport protein CorA n=1 Tax=Clostridium pasteurianum DSM 525 = ATCC 6013 TaxID=1262449 RepID=A0A0H3J863_CLOPA|nr:magnesium/cobalt transporter CorA [Clostridium pasteurianum]AJA49634.1 magnesium and cobalt transport protein CorA [Clostridium pasteurianum DSM 525 = ATCC 6013]AJA53622.1 magnesium and cobalt transport protein CorA [Clostridium pasteurianum DSM 525 = ATCC 6013]AOZ76787.1 metal transporter [Clostridium pasteurianum DSM 525 = ATCC 6013]AOZ80584.1 metal transporter [Clostridium pasteurianum]ELP58850.1 magnesium and cobalt transport protein CorA [Clostridium pasteurianum DSM 525 = ATCC 6013]